MENLQNEIIIHTNLTTISLFLLNRNDHSFSKKLEQIFSSKTNEKHYISKSYSGDIFAIGYSNLIHFAIDIEEFKERSPESLSYFFNKYISFDIIFPPSLDEMECFYKSWVAMESYFKLSGNGFQESKDFTIDLKEKVILKKNNIVAKFKFIYIKNYLICLCFNGNITIDNIEMEIY